MANARVANTIYLDSTGTANGPTQVRVAGIVVCNTHASSASNVILADNDNGASYPKRFRMITPAATTQHFDFSLNPIRFQAGVYVDTLTNAVVTLILAGSGES